MRLTSAVSTTGGMRSPSCWISVASAGEVGPALERVVEDDLLARLGPVAEGVDGGPHRRGHRPQVDRDVLGLHEQVAVGGEQRGRAVSPLQDATTPSCGPSSPWPTRWACRWSPRGWRRPQAESLRRYACDYVQGFLVSGPLPAKEFETFLMLHQVSTPVYAAP